MYSIDELLKAVLRGELYVKKILKQPKIWKLTSLIIPISQNKSEWVWDVIEWLGTILQ